MEATLDKFGRIVLPKVLRDTLGLQPGSVLAIQIQGQSIVLQTEIQEQNLIEKDGILVFTGKATDDLSNYIEINRNQRIRKITTP